MSDKSPEYVLGTHDAELERLGFQARLWADAAHAAWKRAGLSPGWRALDVGCGPGFASFDMGQLVGGRGRVVGVDESPGFVAAAKAGARGRGLAQCGFVEGNAQRLRASVDGPFDLAYLRWVLCFVADPEAVVAEVAGLVRPGGRIVVHDYFNYTSMTCAPKRAAWPQVVEATARSWRARGGDPDVMGRLPAMLERQGFSLDHLEVHQRHARPHETMFHWASTWWRNYVPRLVEMGEISAGLGERFMADLAEIEADPWQFIVMPPVWEVVGTRGG